MSFLIKNKFGKTITEKLKQSFKIYGVPEEIGRDNRPEFVNKYVKNLLNKYKIKFILGVLLIYIPKEVWKESIEKLGMVSFVNF